MSRRRRNKSDNIIIKREEFLKIFSDIYKKSSYGNFNIINFFGVGGVGKSTILQTLKSEYTNKTPVFDYLFSGALNKYNFYESLFNFINANKIKAPYFQLAFIIYWKKINPNIDFKEKFPVFIENSDVLNEILDMIINNETFEHFLSIFAGIAKPLIKKAKEFIVKMNLDEEILKELKEFEKNTDIKSFEEELPYFLGEDLKNMPTPMIFLLDGYEKIYENLNDSNRIEAEKFIENFAYHIQKNSVIVIAGREKTDWGKFEIFWNEKFVYKEVTGLKNSEINELLEKSGLNDTLIKEKIIKTTKGYPFFIKLIFDYYKNTNEINFEEIITQEQLIIRFIGNLSIEETTILEYLSVCEYFDDDIYKYLLNRFNMPYSHKLYKKIKEYSFIKEINGKYYMHDIMKEAIYKSLDSNKNLIHKAMFEYFNKKIFLKKDTKYISDALFHLKKFETEEKVSKWFKEIEKMLYENSKYVHLIEFISERIKYADTDEEKINYLMRLANLYIETYNTVSLERTITEIEKMQLPRKYIEELKFYKLIFEYYKYDHLYKLNILKNNKPIISSGKKLKTLSKKTVNKDLKVKALIEAGNIFRKNQLFLESQESLFEAVEITNDDYFLSKAYEKLGYLFKDMKEYEKSLMYFRKSLQIKEKLFNHDHAEIAKLYLGIANVLNKMNDDNSYSYFVKAVKIFEKSYHSYDKRITHIYKKFLNKEIEWIKKNSLNEELYHYLKLKKFNSLDELKYLESIQNTDKTRLLLRITKALYKIDKNKFENYLQKTLQSVSSETQKASVYLNLFYFLKNSDHKKALEFIDQTLEIYKDDVNNYINALFQKALLFLNMKNRKESLKIFSEIEKISKEQKLYKLLANLYFQYAQNINKGMKYEFFIKSYNLYKYLDMDKKAAEALEKVIKLKIKENLKDKINELLVKLYIKTKNYHKLDAIYGKKGDFYKKTDKNKAKEYYEKQLEIRKKINDPYKIQKGLKFLADIYVSLQEYDKAEKLYQETFEVAKTLDENQLKLASITLINFYLKQKNYEKIEKLLNILEQEAEKSNDIYFKYFVLKELESYYELKNDFQNATEIILKQLELFELEKHPKVRLNILIGAIKNLKYIKDDNLRDYLKFEIFKNNLFLEYFEKAKNVYLTSNFPENKISLLTEDFFEKKDYKKWAFLLSLNENKANEYLNKINSSNELFKAFKALQHFSKKPAKLYYIKYFNLKIKELEYNIEKFEEFFKKEEKNINEINDEEINKMFYENIKRFEELKKSQINNILVNKEFYTVLLNLQKDFDIQSEKKEFLEELYKFFSLISEKNIELNEIKKTLRILSKNYEPYYFGFSSDCEFLKNFLYQNGFDIEIAGCQNFEKLNIKIHSSQNYKKILNALFLEQKGIFFPENLQIQRKIYSLILKMPTTFTIHDITKNIKFENKTVNYLLQNFITAGLLNFTYPDTYQFENKNMEKLKTYAKNILTNYLEKIDLIEFEELW